MAASKRRQPLPVPRVAHAGRGAGSCFHRDVIWECRLSVGWGIYGNTDIRRGVSVLRLVSSRWKWADCSVSCASERVRSKQSARTPRSAARGAARQAGRGEARRWAVRKTGRPLSSNRPAGNTGWTRRGSNPRPSACKAAAPPIELLAHIDIYNISPRKWERNREIPSPSYLRNSSDGMKQAVDYLPVPLPVVTPRPS